MALQIAQAATLAVKKSVAPSMILVTPNEAVQKGMASFLTVGGIYVSNAIKCVQ